MIPKKIHYCCFSENSLLKSTRLTSNSASLACKNHIKNRNLFSKTQSQIEIRDIQMKILDIYKVFKTLCDKHNLRYFAIGGTCIGAVRHGGFIPWDDDLDVVMPYPDYEKFRNVAKTELPAPYSLIDPHERQGYLLSWLKIQDTGTAFIETQNQFNFDAYYGVFMDIFPFVGLPSDSKKRQCVIWKNEWYTMLNFQMRTPWHEQCTFARKFKWIMTAPSKLLRRPFDWYLIKERELLLPYANQLTEFIYFPWRRKVLKWVPGRPHGWKPAFGASASVFLGEDFRDMKAVPFEDTEIYVPIGYDRYLTMDFGDWRQLPPVEKQVSNHDVAIIDLHKSYQEYINRNPETSNGGGNS